MRMDKKRDSEGKLHILVLSLFLKESAIRNRLKKLSNKNIGPSLISKKMEVMFFEDEFIHDEINEIDLNEN